MNRSARSSEALEEGDGVVAARAASGPTDIQATSPAIAPPRTSRLIRRESAVHIALHGGLVASLLRRPLLLQRRGRLNMDGGRRGADEAFEVREQPLLGRLDLLDAQPKPSAGRGCRRRLKLPCGLGELLVKALKLAEALLEGRASLADDLSDHPLGRPLRPTDANAAQQTQHEDDEDDHGPNSSTGAPATVW